VDATRLIKKYGLQGTPNSQLSCCLSCCTLRCGHCPLKCTPYVCDCYERIIAASKTTSKYSVEARTAKALEQLVLQESEMCVPAQTMHPLDLLEWQESRVASVSHVSDANTRAGAHVQFPARAHHLWFISLLTRAAILDSEATRLEGVSHPSQRLAT
jgi:hypothetical protein